METRHSAAPPRRRLEGVVVRYSMFHYDGTLRLSRLLRCKYVALVSALCTLVCMLCCTVCLMAI